MSIPAARKVRAVAWWPLLTTAIVYGITQVPFWLGERWAPENAVFDGLTGMVADQHMYFSFIRQAAEGHWLFENRLTHLEHQPAMFNLQWALVGRLQAAVGAKTAYELWRLAGAFLLVYGFWFLVGSLGRTEFQKRAALLLAVFGGGFGWLFQVLDALRLFGSAPLGQLDVADGLCFPFAQILLNPHVSLSHGLTLFSLGCLVRGERVQSWRWTLAGGALVALNGLIRPYDLIVSFAAVPCYAVMVGVRSRTWSPHATFRRALPLFLGLPVLAYYVFLFRYHPVFRHWSSQGVVETLGIPWHFVNLGLAAILAAVRVCRRKSIPFTSTGEVFLAVWAATALVLFHAHRLPFFGFMPYTPMLGSALGTTLIAFGSAALPDGLHSSAEETSVNERLCRRRLSMAVLAGLVLVNGFSSVVWMVKIPRNLARFPDHYIPQPEAAAADWLARHAAPDEVVLCTLPTGNRLCRFVSARFVAGHVNVTPKVREISARIAQFFQKEMTPPETEAFLEELRVRWIIEGPEERRLGSLDPRGHQGLHEQFRNESVTIYTRDRN